MLSDQILQRLDRLTPKERACLALVARRMSSKDIAAELGIAKTSVDTYCNRARAKLGVADRYEAARLMLAQAAGSAPAQAAEPLAPPSSAPRAGPGWIRRLAALGVAVMLALLALASLVSGVDGLTDIRHQRGLAILRQAAAPHHEGWR